MEKKAFIKSQTETTEIQERILLRKLLLQDLYRHYFESNGERLQINIDGGDVKRCSEEYLAYKILEGQGYITMSAIMVEIEKGKLIINVFLTSKGALAYESL
ncbi:hypothetical protein [Lysinibacillus sphaericus]|uniref:hypothetical protein n=1 Tax=Lysinibacillus sphaericus TaxID=1421 RepID=UPI000C19CA4A|nr:hypothetical protein [Lysinibacillus sphaericus]PIJ97875.1 hypothetical protein CTN02_11275 [Lysinibacillus sphaericus]